MIPLTCNQCDKSLRLRDELAGKRIKCPGCGGVITVPFANAEEDVSPPPRAKAPAAKPTKPARVRDVDDDDEADRPSRKTKSDDGPNKPSVVFLLLGLVLGLGGLVAMSFFIYLAKIANDKANEEVGDKQHRIKLVREDYDAAERAGAVQLAAARKAEIDTLETEIQNVSRTEVTSNGLIAAAFGIVFLVGIIFRGYHFVKMKKWHAAHHGIGKKKKRRDDEDDDD